MFQLELSCIFNCCYANSCYSTDKSIQVGYLFIYLVNCELVLIYSFPVYWLVLCTFGVYR